MTSTVAPFGLAVKRKIVQSCLDSSLLSSGPRRHSTGYDAASSHRGSHAICAPRRTPGARSRIHRIKGAGRRSGRRPMSSINFRDDAMEWLEVSPGGRHSHRAGDLRPPGRPGDRPVVASRGRPPGTTLEVRPFLAGRDYHALHHENPAFNFEAGAAGGRIVWRPYPDVPEIHALTNGAYESRPDWYRRFLYEEERARGLDCVEDLAAPGLFRFALGAGSREAVLILAAGVDGVPPPEGAAETVLKRLRSAERRRRQAFPSPLHRAAHAHLVRRGTGRTIVAGYPWFTDWGRDTFIALRGLCLATGRLDEARDILLEWAGSVSEGMLPNRFPDHGDAPEFNSVDASLWYVVAVGDFLDACGRAARIVPPAAMKALAAAVGEILSGYARGTRHGIRLDDDGLLAAGGPGIQPPLMDAPGGGRAGPPRTGKPVEVQALWLNALWIARSLSGPLGG